MPDFFNVIINKVDESLNPQETRNWGLYIQVSETSFSFVVLDFKKNKFVALHHSRKNEFHPRVKQAGKPSFEDFLKSVITHIPWLKNPFKTIKIAYEGKKSTLMPAPLYDVNEQAEYLRFNFPMGPDEKVFADHLTHLDNFNVFPIPENTLKTIQTHFQGIRIFHHTSVVIYSIWMNYKNRINANRAFIHVREKQFDLMIFDGRLISYFNSFSWVSPDDVAYYLVFVLEQLGYNPENIPVVLMGSVERSSNLHELLFRYVRQVEFGKRNETYKYSYLFSQISPHGYYSLLNFATCGL